MQTRFFATWHWCSLWWSGTKSADSSWRMLGLPYKSAVCWSRGEDYCFGCQLVGCGFYVCPSAQRACFIPAMLNVTDHWCYWPLIAVVAMLIEAQIWVAIVGTAYENPQGSKPHPNWCPNSLHSKEDTIRVRTGMLWGEVMKVLWQKNKARSSRLARSTQRMAKNEDIFSDHINWW